MNLAAVLLAPFALLLHPFQAHRTVDARPVPMAVPAGNESLWVDARPGGLPWGGPSSAGQSSFGPASSGPDSSGLLSVGPSLARVLARPVQPDDAWQIRIESRIQIRITPRAAAPVLPDMLEDEEADSEAPHRYSKIKYGKCVDIGNILGYRPDRGSTLLLYTRDRRLLSAELDHSCQARDFYLGFYMSRTKDGKLCVDRDTLISRSGMNCRLSHIRQLVERDR